MEKNEIMNDPKCIAVIGGWDHAGEYFDSLRLFDCQSTAEAYKAELEREEFDYVLMKVLPVSQYSAMMGGTIG